MKTIHGVEVLTEIEELVDPASTAMIVIDMQNEEVSDEGKYATEGEIDISPAKAIIPNIQRLLDAARRAGVLVTYAEFTHRSRDGALLMDGPSYFVHRDDHFVSCVQEGTWAARTIEELAPRSGELVFSKTRGSAFWQTPLRNVLQTRGIRSLVLTGIATGGCVMATFTDSRMQGYYPVVVSDAVASYDMEDHNRALLWMASRGPVFGVDRILAAWSRQMVL